MTLNPRGVFQPADGTEVHGDTRSRLLAAEQAANLQNPFKRWCLDCHVFDMWGQAVSTPWRQPFTAIHLEKFLVDFDANQAFNVTISLWMKDGSGATTQLAGLTVPAGSQYIEAPPMVEDVPPVARLWFQYDNAAHGSHFQARFVAEAWFSGPTDFGGGHCAFDGGIP